MTQTEQHYWEAVDEMRFVSPFSYRERLNPDPGTDIGELREFRREGDLRELLREEYPEESGDGS